MAHRSIPQAERDGFDAHPIDAPPSDPPDGVPPGLPFPPDRWARLASGLGVEVAPRRSTVAAGVAAAVLVAVVGWWLVRPAAAPVESTVPLAGSSAPAGPGTGATGDVGVSGSVAVPAPGASSSTMPTQVVVQAAGAVGRPGVYRLDTGARVDDLIRQAGGFSPDADRDRVNLAAPLVDGERVWVPARGQTEVPDVVAGGGGGSGAGTTSGGGGGGAGTPSPSAPVDLNTATAEQLDALPGVGPATAAAILAYRAQVGRFGAVDDLLEVRGIGDAKLEQLRPLVRV